MGHKIRNKRAASESGCRGTICIANGNYANNCLVATESL